MKNITFKTYSLGCRANQAEMNDLADKLSQEGFISRKNDLDLLLLNTCAVTGQAEKDTRKAINKLRRENPKAYLVVLGCGIDAKEKLKINLPQADLLVLNKDKESVVQLIKEKFATEQNFKNLGQNKYLKSGRSLLKIQDGCNKFCAYCIVPLLRGKPKS
ncbi:MAG: tRNA (N(6)-L-threonylcarbamoyladenosine(37)-C(2))-methylthiotransferase MtaB, partial [Nanoarchaeota archaeon]|nr:tRNA (N(6)-L-threonylcarbamoyladenosine(37)-C(2))-methylthiotransferase MtaB [Nanoarchaeota archaeon]